MKKMKLTTVASYGTATEADIARGALEAAGFQAFLADDWTIGTLWHIGNMCNGIKVQVSDEDAEQASKLIGEYMTAAKQA